MPRKILQAFLSIFHVGIIRNFQERNLDDLARKLFILDRYIWIISKNVNNYLHG